MNYEWVLYCTLPRKGRIRVVGQIEAGIVSFYHPEDPEELILRITEDRAEQLARMSEAIKSFNASVHKEMIFDVVCNGCGIPCLDLDGKGDILHPIPWCETHRDTFKKSGQ